MNQPQQKSAVEVFRGNLTKMQGEFKLVLPEGVTPEKFTRVVMAAVQSAPHLLPHLQNEDGQRSMIAAAMRCAQDGLMPDNREAAFVVFKGKPQYMPMIGGVRKKILNTGLLSGMPAHVVYENDQFTYELGDNERLEHIPVLKDRGEPIAAYAIAIFKDGYREREVMTVEDINKVRDCAPSKNGPWSTWWDQMAIKTVVKRLAKRLPLDDAASAMIEADNQQFETIAVSPVIVDTSEFDRLTAADAESPHFQRFLAETAKANGMAVDSLKFEAAKDLKGFMGAYRDWEDKQAGMEQPATTKRNVPTKEEMAAKRQSTKDALEEMGAFEAVAEIMGKKGRGKWDAWSSLNCQQALDLGKEMAAQQQEQPQDVPAPNFITCPNAWNDEQTENLTIDRAECAGCPERPGCAAWATN